MKLHTLGPAAAAWMQRNLAVPDGPRYGKPLRLSLSQIRFLCDALTFEETTNGRYRLKHDRAAWIGPKGTGKSPLAAMLAAFWLAGPSIPYDLDERGYLVGKPNPNALVQIFANSERQGLRTVWKPLSSMLRNGAISSEIYIGKTYISCGPGARIDYEASSADSAEGPRTTFAIAEESQYWIGRDLVEMFEAMVRNIAKTDGQIFLPSNAPERGGGSIADLLIRESEKGQDDGLLVHHPKPPTYIENLRTEENRGQVIAALEAVYGDSADPVAGWVDLEQIYRRMRQAPEHVARRFYLNESSRGAGKLVDPDRWQQLARPGQKIPDGSFVVLGFDGSEAVDSTALVAVSLTTPPHVETVGIWTRPEGSKDSDEVSDWRIPKNEVRNVIEACRAKWKVELLAADPSVVWKSQVQDWSEQWGEVSPRYVGDRSTRAGWGLVLQIWWNNSPKLADLCVSHLVGLLEPPDETDDGEPVDEITFTHDDDPRLTQHVLNMLRASTRRNAYATVARASDAVGDQIDGGISLMLALWAASHFPSRDEDPEPPTAPTAPTAPTPTAPSSTANRWAGRA